ncbi:hypothetical protein BH18ACT11_BH18ACT11_16180 [soil metagenome]
MFVGVKGAEEDGARLLSVVVEIVLALILTFALWRAGVIETPLCVAIMLSATALGMVVLVPADAGDALVLAGLL